MLGAAWTPCLVEAQSVHSAGHKSCDPTSSEIARATIGSPSSITLRDAVCETLRVLAMVADNLLDYLGYLEDRHDTVRAPTRQSE